MLRAKKLALPLLSVTTFMWLLYVVWGLPTGFFFADNNKWIIDVTIIGLTAAALTQLSAIFGNLKANQQRNSARKTLGLLEIFSYEAFLIGPVFLYGSPYLPESLHDTWVLWGVILNYFFGCALVIATILIMAVRSLRKKQGEKICTTMQFNLFLFVVVSSAELLIAFAILADSFTPSIL